MGRILVPIILLAVATLAVGYILRSDDGSDELAEAAALRSPAASTGDEVITGGTENSAEADAEHVVESPGIVDTSGDEAEMPIRPSGAINAQEAQTAERILDAMFTDDSRLFSNKLDAYYLSSGVDESWANEAILALTEWFQNENHSINIDCAVDICLMDVTAPYSAIVSEFREEIVRWRDTSPEGFLAVSFYFDNQNGSYRFYFFKDSFHPDSL